MSPLKAVRKRLDLTQFQFAIFVGMNKSKIAKIETGRSKFTFEELARIGKQFGKETVEELVGE